MGLFSWFRRSPPQAASGAPDADGIYGRLPKGTSVVGPDPLGDAQKFGPQAGDLILDLVEWNWDKVIDGTCKAPVSDTTSEQMGFRFLFGLSDGTHQDGVESCELRNGQLVVTRRDKWTVPKGQLTRELALVSLGVPTTNLLRRLEACFGYARTDYVALPEMKAIRAEAVVLRGHVPPDRRRFVARLKIFLPDAGHAEFFMHVNSETRKVWLGEKSGEYRAPILNSLLARG